MPKQEYPKWVYGPDGASKLVTGPEQHQELGGDWYEEPYDKHGKPPAPKPVDPGAIWPGDLTQTVRGAMAPKVEYPKWVYGPDEKSQLVTSDEAFAALGDGWFESPGEAKAGKANPVIDASTAEKPSTPPSTPPVNTPLNVNALNVTEAALYIESLTDLEQLAALAAAEEGGKNRTTVKNAVGARIAALLAPPASK